MSFATELMHTALKLNNLTCRRACALEIISLVLSLEHSAENLAAWGVIEADNERIMETMVDVLDTSEKEREATTTVVLLGIW